MRSRDYAQELGLPTTKKTMPRAIAYVILALVAIGVFFGISRALTESRQRHEEQEAAANPAPAPASSAVPVPAEK